MYRILTLVAASGLALVTQAASADMTVQPVRALDSARTVGYSMLVRKDDSLLARVETSPAVSGEEVWWLVFNNPEACESRPCSLVELYSKDTRADLIRARGGAADGSGHKEYCLKRGKASDSLMARLGLPAAGLERVADAEVQVLVTSTGPGLGTILRRINAGFGESCASGSCDELGIAVHAPRTPPVMAGLTR